MTYRDDVTALEARHDALAGELAQKTRELQQAAQLLDEAKHRAKLPVLDHIRVAAPCSAEWTAMTPVDGDRVRHCGDCNKHVFNLSGMTRDEAESVIVAHQGKLCVRYYQRQDGTILTSDCTVGVARRRRRRLVAAGAAAMLVGGGAMVWRAVRGDEQPRGVVEMGTLAIEELPFTQVQWETMPAPERPQQIRGEPAIEPPTIHRKMGRMARTPDADEE